MSGKHLFSKEKCVGKDSAAGDVGVPVPDYLDENVSGKVVRIIQGFTGVVDQMVWRKD